MVLPLMLACSQTDKSSSHMVKVVSTIVTVMYLLIFILGIYLAVKDMQFVPHTATKFWLLALGIIAPELYILGHGLTSSAQGIGFFSGSPFPSPGAMSSSMASTMPATMPSADSMTPDSDTMSRFSMG
jgi:hypothetical protein